MKVIALYLPQYHEIEQNNIWWGKGYTEWTSLKRGEKLIEGQYQPRIPMNKNYYDLSDINTIKWQVDLARKHGIYGFSFYHYWFNDMPLLEKPIELFLDHTEIRFPFYLCWANEKWTTIWEGDKNPRTLIENDYSNKENIDKHFDYMLKYFKDERYMFKDGKPILCIYNPIAIPPNDLEYTVKHWNERAIDEGFAGICFTYLASTSFLGLHEKEKDLFDYGIEYEPGLVQRIEENNVEMIRKEYRKSYIHQRIKKFIPKANQLISSMANRISATEEPDGVRTVRDYDRDWELILNLQYDDYSKVIPGGFIDWDNTPRHGRNGKVIIGASPQKFEYYFEKLVEKAKYVYHSDTVVLFAWNEWSEGGYLEPDMKWGTGYLEAVKNVLTRLDEYEVFSG